MSSNIQRMTCYCHIRRGLLGKLMAQFFRPSLRGTYCSMSPDMGSGRTEIDAYNGHLVQQLLDSNEPVRVLEHPCALADHLLIVR